MILPEIERYAALEATAGLIHGFICRHPAIDVKTDRETALNRLRESHEACLADAGVPPGHLATGEQVHGARVALCGEGGPEGIAYPETDGLITARAGQFLGIHVADCAAVFLIDPKTRACGLVHSGKKGSELGISGEAIRRMEASFGTDPADLLVAVSPCIRPPDYEIDFAAQIRDCCLEAGVREERYFDGGVSTARDLARYYSYRVEEGQTGRHLAFAGFRVT